MHISELRLKVLLLCVAGLLLASINAAVAQDTPIATATPPPSDTPTPTLTPTLTLTPTATPQGSLMTLQIRAGTDDVNESSGTFEADQENLWIGNGGSTTDQYLALRFTDVPIPPGSVIHAAHLEVYPTSDQWIRLAYDLAAEAADNSAPFTIDDPPSKRELTSAIFNHESDSQWLANTWYPLDEIGAILQAVVSRPGWQMGNSLTLIAQGAEAGGSFGRKFFAAFESDPLLAVRLVIDVSLSEVASTPATITQLPSLTPNAMLNPCSAITLPTRLRVGHNGRVVSAATMPVNVRQLPSIAATRLGRLEQSVIFAVIGGPVCADGVRWFQIRYGENNDEGWIAEGQNNIYFVELVD